jgi:hypothetical protein
MFDTQENKIFARRSRVRNLEGVFLHAKVLFYAHVESKDPIGGQFPDPITLAYNAASLQFFCFAFFFAHDLCLVIFDSSMIQFHDECDNSRRIAHLSEAKSVSE